MELAALRGLVARLIDDWRAMAADGVQYAYRDDPLLAAAAVAGLALVVLAAAAVARRRGPPRDAVAVPALFGAGAQFAPGVDAPSADRAGRAGPAAGAAGPGRTVHRTRVGHGHLSRPAHRADDRRLRQHADVVQGRLAQHPRRNRAGILHDRGRGQTLRGAAPRRQVQRPAGARRVRRSRLRHHPLHERLRQPAAQHRAHRRPDRVLALPRSRHGHRQRASNRASRSSRRSSSSRHRAT